MERTRCAAQAQGGHADTVATNRRIPCIVPVSTTAAFLSTAPRDAAGWSAYLDVREIPVLQRSALAIEDLRGNEDAVDARLLAETIGDDPLMTLKLLRHVAKLRRSRAGTDAETVTAALVMMGIPPFFRTFGPQTAVEQWLANEPEALEGLRAVLRRAHRAAQFALGFAVHRMDHDAAVLHEAALLHDFAEMLLWVHAPPLALQMQRRQRVDPTLRSSDLQREVLNVELADLQQALMKAWHLPDLLVRISDDHASSQPQVRNVQLAIRVARHSALGWDNPALPDDVDEVASLLNMGTVPTLQLLHDLDL
jgi:HD-like signal output (HDOD) protein